jgi:ferredoxin
MSYKVTLVDYTNNIQKTIDIEADQLIMDAFEEAGIDMPYSCKAGACDTCTCTIFAGTADQSEQTYYNEDELEDGNYLVPCAAYPTSDMTILGEGVRKAPENGVAPVDSGSAWDCASKVIVVAGVTGLGSGIGAVYTGGVMFAVPATIIAAGTAAIVTYISDGACR